MTRIERDLLRMVATVLVKNNEIIHYQRLMNDAADKREYEKAIEFRTKISEVRDSTPKPEDLAALLLKLDSSENEMWNMAKL